MKLLRNNRVGQHPKQWSSTGPFQVESIAHNHVANHWRIHHQWCAHHYHFQVLPHHTDMDLQFLHFDLSQFFPTPLLTISQHQTITILVRILLQGHDTRDISVAWRHTASPPRCPQPTDCCTEQRGWTSSSSSSQILWASRRITLFMSPRGLTIFQHHQITRPRPVHFPWESSKKRIRKTDGIRTCHLSAFTSRSIPASQSESGTSQSTSPPSQIVKTTFWIHCLQETSLPTAFIKNTTPWISSLVFASNTIGFEQPESKNK